MCRLQVQSGSEKLAIVIQKNERTHIEDSKNSVEVRLPASDRLFFILHVIASGDCIPLAPFDDVPLDLGCHPD